MCSWSKTGDKTFCNEMNGFFKKIFEKSESLLKDSLCAQKGKGGDTKNGDPKKMDNLEYKVKTLFSDNLT